MGTGVVGLRPWDAGLHTLNRIRVPTPGLSRIFTPSIMARVFIDSIVHDKGGALNFYLLGHQFSQ